MNSAKVFKNGLMTGLFLQLAIGPIFFYVINLALQGSVYNGLVAALAVAIVDWFYIALSIFGVKKLLEKNRFKNLLEIIAPIVLLIFGMLIVREAVGGNFSGEVVISSKNLFTSFISVFILTISSPMTIVFFTSLFASKATEHKYIKKDLYIFGFAVGMATFIFMSMAVVLFSMLKETMPVELIGTLNLIVGLVLIGYGAIRIIKFFRDNEKNKTNN